MRMQLKETPRRTEHRGSVRPDSDSAGHGLARVEHERRIAAGEGGWRLDRPHLALVAHRTALEVVPTSSHRAHRQHPGEPLNITELSMIVHIGTHVDSPYAASLVGCGAEFLFLPLNIVGGDGAPARVLGRATRD
jgi:hypothetical protein